MYRAAKTNLPDITAKLINLIEEEAANSLKRIQEMEKAIDHLLLDKIISKSTYEMVLANELTIDNTITEKAYMREIILNFFNIYHFKTSPDSEGNGRKEELIIGKISNIEDLTWRECNEVIFSRDVKLGGLLSIDLNTLRTSELEFAPKIKPSCNACKIDKSTYFIHGGCTNRLSCEIYACIVNIESAKYTALQNGPYKSSGASVLKNNKIYIFGGINNRIYLATCDTFNLLTKEWESIHPLPQVCNSMTAAMLNKDIIVSGYQIDCCYLYNDSVYSSILKLPSMCYKILCVKDGF